MIPEIIFMAPLFTDLTLKFRKRSPMTHPCLIGDLMLGPQIPEMAEGVECIQLHTGSEERLLIMLPVNVHERSAQPFQEMKRNRVGVQIVPISTGCRDNTMNN